MSFNFQISSNASFAVSKGSRYDAIRNKLFGNPLQHRGLRIKSSLFNDKAAVWADSRPVKLVQRNSKNSRPSKTAASAHRSHDEHHVSEMVHRRRPVEYLGYLITNAQHPDGNWIANVVRMGDAADCAQCSAPYPASYMVFSDAKGWAG